MEDFIVQDAGSSGLLLPDRSVLRRVRVFDATIFGLNCHGSCTVSDSVFSGNGVGITGETIFITQSQVTGNRGDGINVGPSSVVRDNLVSGNTGSGIVARDRSLIVGNNVRGSGGHGIHIWLLGETRVEANNVVSNTGFGIYIETGGNFVVKNSGRGNAAGFLTTNGVTPNVAPVEVGTATNPWANVQY
jgi:parallel beta-helix repeat protein